MYLYGLSYKAVYKVVQISSTFTSCNISDSYTWMHIILHNEYFYL